MVKVKEDLTDKIFGKLTVLKQADDYIDSNGKHEAQWLCKCSCEENKTIVVRGKYLKCGSTKSCGCLKYEVGKYFKKKNQYQLFENYGVLWTTNTNEKVYFDIEDSEKILQHCWLIDISKGYPVANIDNKMVTMHKFLGYKLPDHHNRNKLDNRRENLIPSTLKENNRNMPKRVTNKSGFIGVCWHKSSQKWEAFITVDGKKIYLGCFDNKEDAVYTRLKAELKYFKEFAPQQHLFQQYNIEREEQQ